MSTLFNSQQNININISYNLAHQRVKNAVSKKMHKSTKSKSKIIESQAISKKATIDKNIEKQINSESQKGPKLKKIFIRQLNSPQLLPQRRFKTQIHQTEYSANNKKDYFLMKTAQKKSQNHHKSIQMPISKNEKSSACLKKKNNKNKTKKSQHNHINSCQFNFLKKPFLNAQHITSAQLPAQVERKRRTQSATIFHKKPDKIVSKLINMSLLGSQFGGSHVVSNQKRQQNTFQRLLKQMISSLDMNIIKHMHQDKENQILNQQIKIPQQKPSIISYLTKVKQIPQQQLNKAALKIQNAWKNKMKSNVINYYENLLQKAIYKKTIKQKKDHCLLENPVFQQLIEDDHSNLLDNNQQNEQSNTQQNISFEQYNEDTFNLTEYDIHKNKQDFQKLPKQFQQKSLNIQKYQKLVQQKKKSNQKKQQKAGWNKVSQLLSSNMKTGCKIDNTKILEELIKQSKLIEGWMDDQSQSQNFRDSSNTTQNHSLLMKQVSESKGIQTNVNIQPNMIDEDSQPQNYNSKKYENEDQPQQQWDNQWIRQQLTKTDINNYLDCGLANFGLSTDSQKQQYQQNLSDNEEDLNQDQPISEIYMRNQQNLKKRQQYQQIDQDQTEKTFKQSQKISEQEEQKNKETVDYIIQILMTELAEDIAIILQRSSKRAFTNQQTTVNKKKGILTNFNTIREYLTKIKNYIMSNQTYIEKVTKNLNKELGPTSLEVLSYLRITPDDDIDQLYDELQEMEEDQDHLYAIPIYLFQQFETSLYKGEVNKDNQQYTEKMKPYTNFFHRAIFQGLNQCLDYQKPYGLAGKPYDWAIQPRLPKTLTTKNLGNVMNNAIGRLLQLTSYVGGIIFQKDDSSFGGGLMQQQYRQQVNQERLSRMLANQLFDTEQTWITYNDQIAQALVQVSRMVTERIFNECCAQIKKIDRKRKYMLQLQDESIQLTEV